MDSMYNLYTPLCSLVLSIFLIILFITKVKFLKNSENKFYFIMIIDVFVMTITCLFAIHSIYKGYSDNFLVALANRIECFAIFNYVSSLYVYIASCCSDNLRKNYNIYYITNIIAFLLVMILPISLDINQELTYMVVVGPAVNFTVVLAGIFLFLTFVLAFKNYKTLKEKVIPVIMLTIFLVIIMIVRQTVPEFICLEFLINFATLIMYHTIENPDAKIIHELTYSREMLERANNANSKSLAILTSGIREPLEHLYEFGNKELNSSSLNEISKEMQKLQNTSLQLINQINSALELSKLESGSYKLEYSDYNVIELLEEIKGLLIIENSDHDINLEFEFDNGFVNVLNGDVLKIKQTIMFIYDYLVKNCMMNKLLFKVDSTNAKNTSRLNFSFVLNKQYNYDKLFKSDGVDDEFIHRLLELQNTKLDININDDKMIIGFPIYQKIVTKYDVEERVVENNIIEYFDASTKKILIIDDNKEKVNYLINILKPYNVVIDIAYNHSEYEKKVYNNNWDLILLDDMMPDTNKFDFFKLSEEERNNSALNIENLTNKKLPLVLLVTPNKELNNYSGYDYLLKPIDKKELDIIVKKYLKK